MFDLSMFQIKASTVPDEYWGPEDEVNRTGRYAANVDYITPCTDFELEQTHY